MMQMGRKAICGLGLALAMMATAAWAAPDGAWHLGGLDAGAAWAYSEPTQTPNQIMIGLRLKDAHAATDSLPAYNGATFLEELDCANSRERSIKKTYYAADFSVVKTVDTPTDWIALREGGIYGVLLAKCTGKPLENIGQQTNGSAVDAQKWMAGLVAAQK